MAPILGVAPAQTADQTAGITQSGLFTHSLGSPPWVRTLRVSRDERERVYLLL
jgi:hypothetical protein